jgi:hypothetical protein
MKVRFRQRLKENVMKRHLRARVSGGMLMPLEPIGVPDGSEIDLTMDVPETAKTIPAVTLRRMGSRCATAADVREHL